MGAVVETVYPGAIADWALNRQGCFRADTLAEVGKRQTGMFRSIQALEPKNIEAHILSICGKCVRHPTWYFRKSEQNEIPCKSPCNMWLSTVMEAK
jgi:hypothetical protein